MNTRRHNSSLILSRDSDVLLQRCGDRWQIPCTLNNSHFWQSAEPVNRAVRDCFGLDVITLRCLQVANDEAAQMVKSVYLQRYLGGDLPGDMAWFARDDLPDGLAPGIQGWLATLDDPAHPAWYRLHWYETLAASVGTFDRLEQLRSWERSSVWRVVQNGEIRYLKTVPPMFTHEAPLTRWLGRRFPQNLPLVVDDTLLLMADTGGAELATRPEPSLWVDAMRRMGQIQRELIPECETLAALGVPLRPLSWIREHLAASLLDDSIYRIGDYPLTDDEAARLRAAVPRLTQQVDEIAALNIPLTLEHGDLWHGQIVVRDGDFIFTDWSDATVTHPFFSLEFFNAELANDLPDHPHAAAQATQAYLRGWTAYAPLERLHAVYQRSVLAVSPLYSALRYQHDILPRMAQRWEMHNMVSYYLRHVLDALAD
ncbi:MAG: hypothetical protein H6671_15600 [Anaerolineaceae bacterium]|nr:hypothetical protein [Anaerolineaceae bacterium]